MQRFVTAAKSALKYPIMLLFFLVLAVFTIADIVNPKPENERSEFENRVLENAPEFTLDTLINNQWTKEYGEYVRDRFIMRDDWVAANRALEIFLGRTELENVYLAADGYQIAKLNLQTSFTGRSAERFATNREALAALARRCPGRVTAMIVPSPQNMMRSRLPLEAPLFAWEGQDENALLNDMYAQFVAAGAAVVDLRQGFAESLEKGEQVYYYTDHHWTTDGGAALAYEAFCAQAGLTPAQPDADLRREVPGFLGTNYNKTRYLFTKPDTLVYYDLPNPMTYHKVNADTGTVDVLTEGIMDAAALETGDKYAAFLHGNNGYSVIEGSGEGSILVVKDSYGNSFVPYLTQNYAKVGVIDLRAWQEVSETFAADGYDQILVLYSFDSFTYDATAYRMAR